jgi:hypothetical protein
MGDILNNFIEGTRVTPGLTSLLELTEARTDALSFVEAVVEDHRLISPRSTIPLRGHLKPGTGAPAAEYQVKPGDPFLPLELIWDNPDSLTEEARFRPAIELPAGTLIRFSYHPDPKHSPNARVHMHWNPSTKTLLRSYRDEAEDLSKNIFGVTLSRLRLRYYDHHHQLLHPTNPDSDPDPSALPLITAVEVELTGTLNNHTLTLPGMLMLRNSPRQRGLITLEEGSEFPIADSRTIKTLALDHLTGISNHDFLQVEIIPKRGASYRVTLRFEDVHQTRPLISDISVEYPPGTVIYTEQPRVSAAHGLDLLTVGPNGLYDYDDDASIEDPVYAPEGPVRLRVTRMDIRGAGCFLRP